MSLLERFDESFTDGSSTRFYAEVSGTDSRGGTASTYPGSGEAVSASVQPGKEAHFDEQGVIRFTEFFAVNLLDDPSPLNGGKGCKRGDAFRWSGDARLLVAQNDAVKIGSVWPVLCLASQ